MSDFINTIDALGDDVVMDSIIDRTITEFKDDVLTTISTFAFHSCTALTTVDLPNVTSVNGIHSVFRNCSSLKNVNIPQITKITQFMFDNCTALETIDLPNLVWAGTSAFNYCSSLENVYLPKLQTANGQMFAFCTSLVRLTLPSLVTITGTGIYKSMVRSCSNLKVFDAPSATAIESHGLYNCSGLVALILRNTEAVCSLAASTSLNETAVSSGNLYIYVPSALVEDYKVATNWSTYAAQFRALEDYTVDGTVTGELDESKI